MNKEEHAPFDIHCIEDDVGRIKDQEEGCPGAYYVCIDPEDVPIPGKGEMYVVDSSSPHISARAKKYGVPLPHHPDILLYDIDSEESGANVISYEISLYRTRHHLETTPPWGTPQEVAEYGRELYPEYFGDYAAPMQTPWGPTLRYKRLGAGVFAIETEKQDRVIAVCYAIWASLGLTEGMVKLGAQTSYDRAHTITETKGYLFYPEPLACLVLFELWRYGTELEDAVDNGLLRTDALMNVIWDVFPEYATLFNTREQTGINNIPAIMFKVLGIEGNPEEFEIKQDFISISENSGTEYLSF